MPALIDISMQNLQYVLMHINSVESLNKTGVAAIAEIIFATEPESRVALWLAKGKDGTFGFHTYEHPLEMFSQVVPIPVLQGKFANDLAMIARRAQDRVKETFGKAEPCAKYKITRETVEKVS